MLGVTRRTLLDIAEVEGIAVRESRVTPEDLLEAREVFLTGTTAGVWPVESIDGKPVVMRQQGRVFDEARGTEWRIQIFWPFESAYLIAWLDDGYERAIVGVPSRSNVWLLSRSPNITEAEFVELTDRVAELGYDPSLLKRVPHRATRNAHH